MIVLEIENIKGFMEQLFNGEMFDRFHVRNCEVTTFVTFQIDGTRHDAWYDTDEKMEDATGLVLWQQLKPYVFTWIKGKRVPEKMCLDFCHYMANGDVGSIRIQYEQERLQIFTGYMQKEFSLDRGNQQEWDENCIQFIRKNGIVSTQLN